MMLPSRTPFSRRHFLQSAAVAGAGLLQACAATPAAPDTASGQHTRPYRPQQAQTDTNGNDIRIVAPSGFAPRIEQIQIGLQRLNDAGFQISNRQAAFRRFQRFAGSDAERIADFQEVADGRAATPKILLGMRGGYGAVRLLPHIDWASLGSRMRERQTLFFGFSDVCAVQLALLAKSGTPSFAGPMLSSEFGRTPPSAYTMQSFAENTAKQTFDIPVFQAQYETVRAAAGIFWGGNLSVLAALSGTPYLPDISGGILFLEDVGEQPYRIERMLQTLHLAGILRKQQALVLGDFRMGNIRDVYDGSYDLNAVAAHIRRITGIPVLTGFPFGHIADKATFPLGLPAQLLPDSNGGYRVRFSGHPTIDQSRLNLSALWQSDNPTFFPNSGGNEENGG